MEGRTNVYAKNVILCYGILLTSPTIYDCKLILPFASNFTESTGMKLLYIQYFFSINCITFNCL